MRIQTPTNGTPRLCFVSLSIQRPSSPICYMCYDEKKVCIGHQEAKDSIGQFEKVNAISMLLEDEGCRGTFNLEFFSEANLSLDQENFQVSEDFEFHNTTDSDGNEQRALLLRQFGL